MKPRYFRLSLIKSASMYKLESNLIEAVRSEPAKSTKVILHLLLMSMTPSH